MFDVLRNSWALYLGMLLLLLGNGIQGTLVGIRGSIEGFSPTALSYIMAAYFAGFLLWSQRAPLLIRSVGHVRVFAALASLISAAFILYAAAPSPYIWALMRFIVGFSFSGVYVVAESWLNESSGNDTRGKSLALYVAVQMMGLILSQFVVALGDPTGYSMFVVMSVLVSVSFLPILLSVSTAPAYSLARPMTLLGLVRVSPLGAIGMFLLGAAFSGLFGMSAVFGSAVSMTVPQISGFVATIYVGGLIMQIPIGFLSDRLDRRKVIMFITIAGAAILIAGQFVASGYPMYLALAFVVGGVANPLYSLIIAYTADYLDPENMASATGGLIFINGVGATLGSVSLGYLMEMFGAGSFFYFLGTLLGMIGFFALYRTTQRAAPEADETMPHATIMPSSSRVAVEVAQGLAVEAAEDDVRSDTAL